MSEYENTLGVNVALSELRRVERERDEARAEVERLKANRAEDDAEVVTYKGEVLRLRVALMAAERERDAANNYALAARDELAAYRGEKWSPEHGGSEVDRLKAIIGEIDAQKKKALIERNQARAAGHDLYRSLKAFRGSGVGQSMNYTPWADGADAVLKKWEEMP